MKQISIKCPKCHRKIYIPINDLHDKQYTHGKCECGEPIEYPPFWSVSL